MMAAALSKKEDGGRRSDEVRKSPLPPNSLKLPNKSNIHTFISFAILATL